MSTKPRTDALTTVEMYQLDEACALLRRAFGRPAYLVGSAGIDGRRDPRDVDVRLILDDAEFDALFAERPQFWEWFSLTASVYLRERTGLAIDFQVQRQTDANAIHHGPRNPLGMGRVFAGGGDGTKSAPRPEEGHERT